MIFNLVSEDKLVPDMFAPTHLPLTQLIVHASAILKRNRTGGLAVTRAVASARQAVYSPEAITVTGCDGVPQVFTQKRGMFVRPEEAAVEERVNISKMVFGPFTPDVKKDGKVNLVLRDAQGLAAPALKSAVPPQIIASMQGSKSSRDAIVKFEEFVRQAPSDFQLQIMCLFPQMQRALMTSVVHRQWADIMLKCSDTRAPMSEVLRKFVERCKYASIDFTPSYAKLPVVKLTCPVPELLRYVHHSALAIPYADPHYRASVVGDVPLSVQGNAEETLDVKHLFSRVLEKAPTLSGVFFCGNV
jgi:hypothetical protein